ncbi:MAG: hypothetical protein R2734_13255 [Nocardioides sp.]
MRGASGVAGVDAQEDPLATVGKDADLAVTGSGVALAASAENDVLLRLRPHGGGFAPPVSMPLPTPVDGTPAVTAVGEVPVVLDVGTGSLAAVGAARAVVETGSVLQQPGPSADSVLLATASALMTVDLHTGALDTVAGGLTGRPTQPVRLGAWCTAPGPALRPPSSRGAGRATRRWPTCAPGRPTWCSGSTAARCC